MNTNQICYNGPEIFNDWIILILLAPYMTGFTSYISPLEKKLSYIEIAYSAYIFTIPYVCTFFQNIFKIPRPDPNCTLNYLSLYSFPLPEIVCVTSSMLIRYFNRKYIKNAKINYLFIFICFFWLVLYSVIEYVLNLATINQIFASVVFGILVTILFFPLLLFLRKKIATLNQDKKYLPFFYKKKKNQSFLKLS